MNNADANMRKAKERKAKRGRGLVPMEVWAHPQDKAKIKAFATLLIDEHELRRSAQDFALSSAMLTKKLTNGSQQVDKCRWRE